MLSPAKRLLKNSAFRMSVIASSLFALSSLIVLGYIYYATVISELNQVDRNLQAELKELVTVYHKLGPDELNKIIIVRMLQPGSDMKYVYEYNGRPTGNLNAQPTFTDKKEWNLVKQFNEFRNTPSRKFTYQVEENRGDVRSVSTHRARGQFKQISPEAKLFVARDVERIMAPAERVTRALLVSMAMAILFGILSGIFVARRFSKRIGAFNKLADDVRAGQLSKRISRNESGDELDILASHLNDMLDHIDRLMQAMRYAGDSIAHDLRSPLTRLRTRLDNAGTQITDEEAQAVLFEASEDAGQLLRTFDSVLRIARLEAGERREYLIELDPVSLLEDIAELYEPAAEDAGLGFALEISGRHKILADRGLLSQAVSNLVENAIKYTPNGGAITVRLRKIRSGKVEISITDTGLGIPAQDRERVKERFVRLEKSRTLPGSGLGLSLVEAVADLHRAQFILEDGPVATETKDDNKEENNTEVETDHDEAIKDDLPGLRASLVFPRFKK